MRNPRKLQLRREAMTDLGPDDLRAVAAGEALSTELALCVYLREIIRQSALPTCWCTPTCI